MMAAVWWALKNWKLMLAGALVLYIGWLQVDLAIKRADLREAHVAVDTLTGQLNTAESVNRANVEALAAVEARAKRTSKALADANARAAAATAKALNVEKEIANVPTDQNCVLGPAVGSVLERLWRSDTAAPVH